MIQHLAGLDTKLHAFRFADSEFLFTLLSFSS
jgi:hypothetical protein